MEAAGPGGTFGGPAADFGRASRDLRLLAWSLPGLTCRLLIGAEIPPDVGFDVCSDRTPMSRSPVAAAGLDLAGWRSSGRQPGPHAGISGPGRLPAPGRGWMREPVGCACDEAVPREGRIVRRMLAGATVTGGAVAVYALLVRSRCLRWGATGQESGGPLPGDDLIADPDLTATRAITVRAPASRVWPWIAQLGQGRGGFYSYDFLENLADCDVHSADRIVPEWQDVMAGDQVRLAPQANLAVAYLERGRSLVLRGGIPMGNTAPPYDFTWAFVLEDGPAGQRGCSCAKDMRTRGHGPGSSSSPLRRSAS